MVAAVESYDEQMLLGIARSFSNFLALTNTAENFHRIRKLREYLKASGSAYGLWPKEDSCAGSIQNLLKSGITKEAIIKAIEEQSVELVLTAHPTEVNRRTMLRKHNRINDLLWQLNVQNLSPYEIKDLQQALKSEIATIWESDNLRRTKPTPEEEARWGLAIVENVLWKAVPNFLRKLDDVLKGELGQGLPWDRSPIKIASWMGGDRDGNPNVTPETTMRVAQMSRWMAATLYLKDISELRTLELSIQRCSPELKAKVENLREPYRELLKKIELRLQATIHWTEDVVIRNLPYQMPSFPPGTDESLRPILRSSELMEPLQLMYRSLKETGMEEVAERGLADIIRRVATFGVTLLPLDVRQESTRHTEALDAITRYLGLGSYAQWDETTRRTWLQAELTSKRPLLPTVSNLESLGFSNTAIDTLRTFQMTAMLDQESLGAYVISQCQQASDILAVALLQKNAGVKPLMRVVPLFETLDDLQRAPSTIDALFSISTYRGLIANKQEVMVGYSDSAKDAGRLAASWAQYNSQVDMVEVAKRYGVELTFFHGKGGTVGRGGNPALFQAILAHPPHTINGRFRVTEQGEMITQNLGEVAIAERTLDLFTAGVLSERFISRPQVKAEWRESMERLSDVSCDAYRAVVQKEERFVPYFRTATPEGELAGLNVGSRPSKRNPKGGVESLRAIPWVFSWTQTRLNLPTWLGVGEALEAELASHPALLQEMVKEWPWFRTLIDLLEMVLVKSEPRIAENYDRHLVHDEKSLQLGKELRENLSTTSEAVLKVSGSPYLQASNAMLLRSLLVRNPYIDPLNLIQAEVLKRLRDEKRPLTDKQRTILQDTLLITINGVANGMRNSG